MKLSTYILILFVSIATCSCTYTENNPSTSRVISNQDKTNIIIIGAGISGISAAHKLHQYGFKHITILEARNRIGGRIHTIKNKTHPEVAIDLGASWIHGDSNENPLKKLAKKYNIKAKAFDLNNSYTVYDNNGNRIDDNTLTSYQNKYSDFLEYLDKSANDNRTNHMSVGKALHRYITENNISKKDQAALLFFSNLFIEFQYANDINHLSLYFDNSESYPGVDKYVVSGYKKLIDHLAKPIRRDIRLNQAVTSIDYTTPNNIIVTTSKGETFNANYVICTVPIGVLKSNSITFTPALPENKQMALKHMDMNIMDKVILTFPTVFWDNTQFIGHIPDASFNEDTNQWRKKGQWPAFVNLNYYDKQPILIAFIAGNFAKKTEGKTNTQIEQEVMQTLKSMYPNKNIPQPIHVTITRWGEKPYSRGSYTSLNTEALPNNQDLVNMAAPIAYGHLMFAGEGTSITHSTTVHGAYETGLRAAKHIKRKVNRDG
jgi:monoamine oxidase